MLQGRQLEFQLSSATREATRVLTATSIGYAIRKSPLLSSVKLDNRTCFYNTNFFSQAFITYLLDCTDALSQKYSLPYSHYARRYISNGMIMSNSHSANWRERLTSSEWLKVNFWIHGPSSSERLLFVGPLCDVSAATWPCIQKSTLNQSEFVERTRKFAEWPLDMYPSAGHSI